MLLCSIMVCIHNIMLLVGPGKKMYHKYDMIVYPKKTQISKSLLETLKGLFSTRKSEEFIPMDLYNMSIFCLRSYLENYESIMCEGKFQQGTNIIELVDNVIYIFDSLMSFAVRTQGFATFLQEVPNKNKYRGVCHYNDMIIVIVIKFCHYVLNRR